MSLWSSSTGGGSSALSGGGPNHTALSEKTILFDETKGEEFTLSNGLRQLYRKLRANHSVES